MIMTVAQYQKIYEINNTTPDTVERLGWTVCALFGKTEDEVNHMKPIRFLRYVNKIENKLKARPSRFRRIRFQTNAYKIALGQFIECQYWLKNDPVLVMDLVAASILVKRKDHAQDAERMQSKPFNQVLPAVEEFIESMNGLIKSYSGLFEQPEEEPNEQYEAEKVHPFLDQYGWIFSATEVAKLEGITLEQAYSLPIVQAFNDMAYLKAKAQYEKSKNK